jgi:hypothetical protein
VLIDAERARFLGSLGGGRDWCIPWETPISKSSCKLAADELKAGYAKGSR